ncbi:MAG: taurine dioxygenase [Oceanicoccus sp.]|jgi:taurine dioxygenase
MDYKTISVKPLTPHLGAEIGGVNLAAKISDQQFADIHKAWLDWSVLVFRDQDLSQEAHKAFAQRFGRLHIHPLQHDRDGDPAILTVKTTEKSAYTAGDGWHTDVTCDEKPPLGSMLYITETPECGGGDTLFADMYLAYELLSDTMKNMLSPLLAVHDGALPYIGSYQISPESGSNYPRNEHPVIITHPESGKKLLYVNSGFTSHIKGLKKWESRALLDALFRHIDSTPRLVCRVAWEPGTLTFWDNRCTQHHAVWDYFPHSRYGERVSIVGRERPCA